MNSAETSETALRREQALKELIRSYESIAIAFSGGVDSAYLADVASEELRAAAFIVLADSPSIPRSEVAEAAALAQGRGWNFHIVHTHEFENERYLSNDGSRCYHCRTELFTTMRAFAAEHGVQTLAYGEMVDDRQDPTRLGAQAAREYRVVAPLAEAGLGKDDIRLLSERRGLPTWDKPSFACLASRLPKGTPVDRTTLSRIEATEEILKTLGFRQYRVRHHSDLCRIELEPADIARLAEPRVREAILQGAQAAGYRHVTLDLAGYRTGSTAT